MGWGGCQSSELCPVLHHNQSCHYPDFWHHWFNLPGLSLIELRLYSMHSCAPNISSTMSCLWDLCKQLHVAMVCSLSLLYCIPSYPFYSWWTFVYIPVWWCNEKCFIMVSLYKNNYISFWTYVFWGDIYIEVEWLDHKVCIYIFRRHSFL